TAHPTMVLQVGHSGTINTLAYSPDRKTLATGGDDGAARVGGVGRGHMQATPPPHTAGARLTAPPLRPAGVWGRDGGSDWRRRWVSTRAKGGNHRARCSSGT